MTEHVARRNGNKQSIKKLCTEIWKARIAYLFLLPMFIGVIMFGYYPPLMGLYRSLFDWRVTGRLEYVGLNNFKLLFQDITFLNSFPVMLKLFIPKLIIGVTVPFIMSELLLAVQNIKLKSIYRVLILLPMITPGVVGTLLWKYIYNPQDGIVTAIFRLVGILGKEQVIDWLNNPRTVIPAIIFMGFPWVGGSGVLIYLSGLIGIGNEIFESAKLDGANTIKRIWYIDIPSLIGQFRYFLIFGIIGGLQDYGVQVILTRGGPGYSTYVPGYYMYTVSFTGGLMGYGCAIGTILFILIFIVSTFTFRYLKDRS